MEDILSAGYILYKRRLLNRIINKLKIILTYHKLKVHEYPSNYEIF